MQILSILGLTDKSYLVNYDQLATYLTTVNSIDNINIFATPILFYAIRQYDLRMVQMLLKKCTDISHRNPSNMTPLIFAIWHTDENKPFNTKKYIILEILKYKQDLDLYDNYGDTAFMTACLSSEYEDIALILINDFKVNVHKTTTNKTRRVIYYDHNHCALSMICAKGIKNYHVQKRLIELNAHKTLIARTNGSIELLYISDNRDELRNVYLTREFVNAGAQLYYNNSWDSIFNILMCPELSDLWDHVMDKIKTKDTFAIYTKVLYNADYRNTFIDKYISINGSKIFDTNFTRAANIYTDKIKKYLFDILFGQFNRKGLNKYITYKIIDLI
jgi:hypothetical protein